MIYQLNNDNSELHLVRIRINSDSKTDIDFYTLYLGNEKPIDSDGFPIFFLIPMI
jgi:hypothetical protein